MNAFPIAAFAADKPTTFSFVPIKLEELAELVKRPRITEVVSYIRHQGTIKLLSKLLGLELQPSSGLYKYSPEDLVVIIVLKKPVRGQEVEPSPEDLAVYMVVPATPC